MAQRWDGEIIAADSRTIYRGIDIATAKPTIQERALIPHHLLDIVRPDEAFSAAAFKDAALKAIHEIASRGKLPILVGGTGLYIDSILYDFQFQSKADPAKRKVLQGLSIEELHSVLRKRAIPLPKNERNPRHLIRAIETEGQVSERRELRSNTLVIGLAVDRPELKQRLERRVDAMMDAGLFAEIQGIAERFGWDAPGLQTSGFKALKGYFDGEFKLGKARELFVRDHLKLAKRQRTWFRRNADIHWICKKEEAVDLMTTFLNK
jgi:tRNA dimethylallyltransferase